MTEQAHAVSVSSVRIRLPEERWQHIIREHPKLEGLQNEVLVTVENPAKVLEGSFSELLAIKEVSSGKFLVVV
ncbi:MAG: hypothetical protein QME65_06680 [Candidatus Omnitrophota bacterium]|nr:hypothetical protein [Candidatus Omnitrophota bacterium]